MRVLVLGGTGAMGLPLVKQLSERGDEVYVTSRRQQQAKGNIHFIQGDAHDLSFIQQQRNKNYDAIVDFMIYGTDVFKKRAELYLGSTGQYMFLSSARVYADSYEPITEKSPRLLDVCKDEAYLKTDEYALAKARSENVLFNSNRKNWTIIRPYITYNIKRLQLGGLELGSWLIAALSGRPIVLPEDVGMHKTTMTYGDDVAKAMVALIGNPRALGEAFHITGPDYMTWRDVAETYCDVIEEFTGRCPELYRPDTSDALSSVMGNATQIMYDRMYDRIFDSTKLMQACGGNLNFTPMREGLRKCLEEYLKLPEGQKLKDHNVKFDAWLDRSTGRGILLKESVGTKEKLKYFGYYYAPGIMNILKTLNRFSVSFLANYQR